MNITELKTKTRDELITLKQNFAKELMNLRFQKTSGELKNTSRFSEVRKSVARINFLLNAGTANA